ncbi:MAG: hypothetical protein ABR903_05055 [Thermodesulfovibrionales bacterium]|jgi:hypothetical protein
MKISVWFDIGDTLPDGVTDVEVEAVANSGGAVADGNDHSGSPASLIEGGTAL